MTSGERLDDSMFDGVLHIRGRRLPPFAERDTEEARVARGRAGSGAEGGGARRGDPLGNGGVESGKVGAVDSERFREFCSEMDLTPAGNGLNSAI